MSNENPMDYSSLPGNSKSKKPDKPSEKPKLKSVVEGTVIQQKKPWHRKFVDTFTGEDVTSVGGYLVHEIVIPTIKSLLVDMLSKGGERLIYGEISPRGATSSRGGLNYSSISTSRQTRTVSQSTRRTHNFGEILLETRVEAEEVLTSLGDLIDGYGSASVSDLYDLIGVSSQFTDERWGWTNLNTARAVPVRNGYLLELPKTVQLD